MPLKSSCTGLSNILPLPGDVEISTVYLEEERPTRLFDIDYLKPKVSKTQKKTMLEKGQSKKRSRHPKKSNSGLSENEIHPPAKTPILITNFSGKFASRGFLISQDKQVPHP